MASDRPDDLHFRAPEQPKLERGRFLDDLPSADSEFSGEFRDTQKAAVPGATVVVRNTATGVERTIVTDASGNFAAASLPPGPYQVEVSLPGAESTARGAIAGAIS